MESTWLGRKSTTQVLCEKVKQLESDLATAEQDSRQKQARIARLEAAVKDLRVVIAEVHAWAVCAAIAGPEDMYENFPRIVEIGERVLKNTEDV